MGAWAIRKGWIVAAVIGLTTAAAQAQIGPGEFDEPVGEDPSVGQGSQPFFDDPPAGEAPSVGEASGEMLAPPAGEDPSIGGANEPFEQPGEGAPYGRMRPFD